MRIRQKKYFNSTQSLFNSNEKSDPPSPFTSEFSQFSPQPKQPKSSLDKTRAQLQHLQQSSYNFGNIGISQPVTDASDLQQKTNPENNQGIKQNLAPLIQRDITSRSSNHLQASPPKSLPQKINLQRHSSRGKDTFWVKMLEKAYLAGGFPSKRDDENIAKSTYALQVLAGSRYDDFIS